MMKCKFERTVGGVTLPYTLRQRAIERERVGEWYAFV